MVFTTPPLQTPPLQNKGKPQYELAVHTRTQRLGMQAAAAAF